MNYYKRHLGDYAKDTAHLSMIEEGAYTRLLDYYYTIEGPLPLDKAQVYRRVRATSKHERAAVDVCLKDFFCATDNGYAHVRCEREIQRMREKAETNREIGKRGGRPKKETQTVSTNNPQETQTVSGGNPQKTLATNPLATNPLESQKHDAGASTESADASPQASPLKALFDAGAAVLVAHGMRDQDARKIIGMLRKSKGDEEAKRVIESARDKSDPERYIAAACRPKGSKLAL